MNMEGRLLVLSVSRFDGNVDGKHYRSAKCFVLADGKSDDDHIGLRESVLKMPYDLYTEFKELPAIYSLGLRLVTDHLEVCSVRFLESVDLPVLSSGDE